MAKGVPTACSQRYKATRKAKESIISIPPTSKNDALPLLFSISEKPVTQADGAQRAFSTVRVPHQSLLHAASPGTHRYDLLQVMASYIFDCSEWYRESEVRNLTLQQQLNDLNSKLLDQFNVQNAEILKLQDQLKTSQAAQDFYRHQALQAEMIPPGQVVAVASFYQTPMIFRPLKFTNNCFWLAMTSTFAIAPWRGSSSS
jgi:hypothetical protein